MPHTCQDHASAGIFQKDVACRSLMTANFRSKVFAGCGYGGHYCQHLQLVDIVLEFIAVDAVDYRSAHCFDVASSALCHLPHDLQLSRGTFFELSAVEPYFKLTGMFSGLLEGVWAEFILLIPVSD